MTGSSTSTGATGTDNKDTSSPSGIHRMVPWIGSLAILLLLVGLYFVWPAYHNFLTEAWNVLSSGDTDRIENWVSRVGLWGPLLVVFIMVLQMFLIIAPSWLIMVISVLAYGPVMGGLLSILSVAVAASVGYGLGRLAGDNTLHRFLGESKRKAIQKETDAYGMWAVIITRLNPLLSNDAVSVFGGILRLGYLKFIAATMAGIIPLAAAIAAFGEDWKKMKTGLIILSGLSLIGLGVKIWFDKRRKS